MTLYWVETKLNYRICYAVEAEEQPDPVELERRINEGTIKEVAQQAGKETILGISKITTEEYLAQFDKEWAGTPFVGWDDTAKLNQITNLDEAVVLEDTE